MADELSELLERVAADGADRSTLTAEGARGRGARIHRHRAAGGVLGAAVLVTGVLAGAVLVGQGGSAEPSHPVASTNAPAAPRTPPTPCRQVARDGDVDGDCRVDAVSIEGDTLVVQGTRSGRMTVRLVGIRRHPTTAVSMDIDRDGLADVLVTGGYQRYGVVRSTGTGLVLWMANGYQAFSITLGAPLSRYKITCTGNLITLFVQVPGTAPDGTPRFKQLLPIGPAKIRVVAC